MSGGSGLAFLREGFYSNSSFTGTLLTKINKNPENMVRYISFKGVNGIVKERFEIVNTDRIRFLLTIYKSLPPLWKVIKTETNCFSCDYSTLSVTFIFPSVAQMLLSVPLGVLELRTNTLPHQKTDT